MSARPGFHIDQEPLKSDLSMRVVEAREGSLELGLACHRLFARHAKRKGCTVDEASWDHLSPGWRERRGWGA